MASALYGILIGISFLVFTRVVPQPLGSIILWGFFSAQLPWGAAICWRRTGLAFVTAAMALGGAMSAGLLVLATTGRVFPSLLPESWVLLGAGLVMVPLFLLIESQVNRAKWKQWARYMESKNVWDIVTGRHIPQIRNGGA